MKSMKRVLALVLALVMCLGLATVAMATDATPAAGSITIKNAAIGQQYTLYKVFNATYNATTGKTAYTITADTELATEAASATNLFKLGAANAANERAIEFIGTDDSALYQWIAGQIAAGRIVVTEGPKEAESTTLTFNTTAYGYYYITTTHNDGGAVTVDSNTPYAELIDKNKSVPDVPDPEKKSKKITAINNTPLESATTESTAKIGDTVSFEVKFNAVNVYTPENAQNKNEVLKVTKYTITDTSSALDIDWEHITVKVGDKTLEALPAGTTTGEGYVLSDGTGAEGESVKVITLPWVDAEGESIYDDPSLVTVTYTATVTEAAADGSARNKAEIKFNDTEPPFNTTDDEVKTYKFQLVKTDSESTLLTGAKFELYADEAFTEQIAVVKDGNDYRVAEEGETGVEIEAGNVVVKGLKGNTTYYLKETEAPAGYNKLETATPVVITNADLLANKDPEGNIVRANEIRVVNNAGTNLPSTGGIGTTIFYVIGGILVVGAGVLLVTKKRMAHHD